MTAQTIIVTGGTSGIGAAVSTLLVNRGFAVLATSRNQQPVGELKDALGERFAMVAVDHRSDDAPQSVLEALSRLDPEVFGELVGLVNNVGARHNDLIGEHAGSRLSETFELNVTATVLMTQAVVPLLERRGGGSVVNVSSRLAVAGMSGVSGYAASKGAINGFTVAAAIELAPKNIRVNAVAPGMTKTPLIEAWLAEQGDPVEAERVQASKVPLGRLCTEEDVARAAAFLLSTEAEYITGVVLPVDGGYTAA